MNNRWIALILTALSGCATAPKNTLTQVSTIDALLAGSYDGQMTVNELLEYGDLGIGTFDALEGEMIVIDHQVFQARADGTVHRIQPEAATPFAGIVNFQADAATCFDRALTEATFQTCANELAPDKNLFVAVRFDGHFPLMKVRSVPKQEAPYPPLAEAAKSQSVFEYACVSGTVLGFRCPEFVKGVNVPGWHLHFISDDRTKGGHILGFTTTGGTLQIDKCNRFYMVLPEDGRLRDINLAQDRSEDLRKAEQ